MSSGTAVRSFALILVFVALGVGGLMSRSLWLPYITATASDDVADDSAPPPVEEPKVLKMSAQARKNLSLVSKPARPTSYWETVQIPGVIVDRPGVTDRGVTSPVVGAVTEIHAFPGDTIRPGERLFTLKLYSEYLQNTQKELFKAVQETKLVDAQLARLRPLSQSGGIAQSKIIDLENQRRRQDAIIEAQRQDLITRGLNPEQVAQVESGQFVSTVEVVAPPPIVGRDDTATASIVPANFQRVASDESDALAYEVQELSAELGQQVQAGQLLATLANHGALYIEGHAFKQEAPALARAAEQRWTIQVEFAEDDPASWPTLAQTFSIRHLANSIDTQSRTFDFFVPLKNQSRDYQQAGQTFVVWRFRPGQRVRLHVPVSERNDVLVLPAEAVVREGPEAYVFWQNGDLFNRTPVHVLHEDRRNIVLANDGSVTPGAYLAQSSAASLNRVLKAQAASGMRADVHVHADGTVHASH